MPGSTCPHSGEGARTVWVLRLRGRARPHRHPRGCTPAPAHIDRTVMRPPDRMRRIAAVVLPAQQMRRATTPSFPSNEHEAPERR